MSQSTAFQTILLVEEDSPTACDTARKLNEHGYEVMAARDAQHARELLCAGSYADLRAGPPVDLILMDVNLGGHLQGARAAGQLLQEYPLPLIFLIEQANPETIAQIERISPYGYILKNSGAQDLRVYIDMAQRLHQSTYRLCQNEKTLTFLAQSAGQGQQFIEELALHLTGLLPVEQILVGRLEPGGQTVSSMAFYNGGRLSENISFQLKGSACAALFGHHMVSIPFGVRDQFPQDALLQSTAAENFTGIALKDSGGEPIGVITVFGSRPLPNPQVVVAILELVSNRAAAELARKQADEALRASEARYRSLVEISPIAISLSDLSGNFITANQAALKQLGFHDLEELLDSGLTTYGAIAEADRQRAIDNAIRALEGNEVRKIEYQVVAQDGTQTPVEISAAAVRDSNGNPFAFIGISQDISERKAAEAAQARALAEKSTLLRDLQHRIKNSLALIASLIMLEQQNAQQPETRSTLEDIYDRVNSLSELYNILYETHNTQQVQLDQYLETVAHSLAASYLHNRAGITLHLELDPLPVDAHQATPFGLILNELLTNALKYAFPDDTGGKIWVKLGMDDSDLSLEVSDSGVGLPAGFESRDYASGLGFQLVKLLVQQLGGRLTCGSNQKTFFNVRVPYLDVAPPIAI